MPQKQETLSYENQFGDTTISFSPFVLSSTGILQSQTSLKVDTYSLVCVPYQLSMQRAVLIGAFSKDEIIFFQRFKGALAGLSFTVQRASSREPEKIFCRCQVAAVGQMRGREHVGLVVCDFKPIPPDLATILGEHLIRMDRLKAEWADFKDRVVQISPESSRRLGFNNYAVMNLGQAQHKLALYSLASNRADFLMPLRSPDVGVGTAASFNLFFQKYRFGVAGKVISSERLPTGVQRLRAEIDFSPELTDILSNYFFTQRIAARNA
jgi:hypothetical protein